MIGRLAVRCTSFLLYTTIMVLGHSLVEFSDGARGGRLRTI